MYCAAKCRGVFYFTVAITGPSSKMKLYTILSSLFKLVVLKAKNIIVRCLNLGKWLIYRVSNLHLKAVFRIAFRSNIGGHMNFVPVEKAIISGDFKRCETREHISN